MIKICINDLYYPSTIPLIQYPIDRCMKAKANKSGASTKKVSLKEYFSDRNSDNGLDGVVMISKIGNNYAEFKTCMEKYARDWWY